MIVEGDLEKSKAMQEEMIATAEEFFQSLGFPYHVIKYVRPLVSLFIIVIIISIIVNCFVVDLSYLTLNLLHPILHPLSSPPLSYLLYLV